MNSVPNSLATVLNNITDLNEQKKTNSQVLLDQLQQSESGQIEIDKYKFSVVTQRKKQPFNAKLVKFGLKKYNRRLENKLDEEEVMQFLNNYRASLSEKNPETTTLKIKKLKKK